MHDLQKLFLIRIISWDFVTYIGISMMNLNGNLLLITYDQIIQFKIFFYIRQLRMNVTLIVHGKAANARNLLLSEFIFHIKAVLMPRAC